MRNQLLLREQNAALEIREASIRPRTFNAAARTVEMTVATAHPVARGSFDEILNIDGADLSAFTGAPLINGHRSDGSVDQVIGSIIAARVENGELIATAQLSDLPEVAGIVRNIERGILKQVSVGYSVEAWAEGTANGRRTRTATRWTPKEVSVVAVAADPHARIRSQEPGRARQIFTLVERAQAPQSLALDLIDADANDTEVRAALFSHLNARMQPQIRSTISMDYNDPAVQNRTVADAIYAKMTGQTPTGAARELACRSATDIMIHYAKTNGIALRSEAPAEVFTAVMTRAAPMAMGDFPTLLGDNVMGRRLGELFAAAQSGASAIVAPGTVRDFRPTMEVRLSSFPELLELPENSEIKFSGLSEEGEQLVIASYARAVSVGFKLMVNDDLNGLDRSIRDVAFATTMLKAKLIIAAMSATMSDGATLFDVSHSNLAGGVSGDAQGLSAGRLAMAKQCPPNSTEPLGLSPSIILVPSELQTSAEKAVATIQPVKSADANPFAGRLQVAVEPRLINPVAWYLFAAPGTWPTIRFVTLAGFEGPKFESNAEFSKLGMSYRVHWHVGAGPVDYRGAWKAASGPILATE